MEIEIEITEDQADVFAEFAARITWEDARKRTLTDEEAYTVLAVMERLREAV